MSDALSNFNLPDTAQAVRLTTDLAYFALAGTAAITFVGALDEKAELQKRQALATETAVNAVAAFVYKELRDAVQNEDSFRVMNLRYIDWAITTPLLLGSLVLYMTYHEKPMRFAAIASVIALNMGMLLFGYLGINQVPTEGANVQQVLSNAYWIVGLLCFVGMAAILLLHLKRNYVLWIFLAVWLLYGIVYFTDWSKQQILYNCLDVVSKAGFGVFLYFVKRNA